MRSIANIESTGLDLEGIYRVPGPSRPVPYRKPSQLTFVRTGKLATIQQLVHRMEKEEEAFAFGPNDDPAAVAGVLKVRMTRHSAICQDADEPNSQLYLRQLPTPVFPFAPQECVT